MLRFSAISLLYITRLIAVTHGIRSVCLTFLNPTKKRRDYRKSQPFKQGLRRRHYNARRNKDKQFALFIDLTVATEQYANVWNVT